jgi:hypothetical protein
VGEQPSARGFGGETVTERSLERPRRQIVEHSNDGWKKRERGADAWSDRMREEENNERSTSGNWTGRQNPQNEHTVKTKIRNRDELCSTGLVWETRTQHRTQATGAHTKQRKSSARSDLVGVHTLETEKLSTITSRSNEDHQFEHL